MWMWNAPSSRGRRIELSVSETGITSITIAGDKCRSEAELGDFLDKLIGWRSLPLENRVDRCVGCGPWARVLNTLTFVFVFANWLASTVWYGSDQPEQAISR
jgi:hypothetical protein